MGYSIVLDVEEQGGKYAVSVRAAPDGHRATARDPMDAIRGAIVVSRGVIDDTVGYDRGAVG